MWQNPCWQHTPNVWTSSVYSTLVVQERNMRLSEMQFDQTLYEYYVKKKNKSTCSAELNRTGQPFAWPTGMRFIQLAQNEHFCICRRPYSAWSRVVAVRRIVRPAAQYAHAQHVTYVRSPLGNRTRPPFNIVYLYERLTIGYTYNVINIIDVCRCDHSTWTRLAGQCLK